MQFLRVVSHNKPFPPKVSEGILQLYQKTQGLIQPQYELSMGRGRHTIQRNFSEKIRSFSVISTPSPCIFSVNLSKQTSFSTIPMKHLWSWVLIIWMWSNPVITILFKFYWHLATFNEWCWILLHDTFSCLIFVNPYSSFVLPTSLTVSYPYAVQPLLQKHSIISSYKTLTQDFVLGSFIFSMNIVSLNDYSNLWHLISSRCQWLQKLNFTPYLAWKSRLHCTHLSTWHTHVGVYWATQNRQYQQVLPVHPHSKRLRFQSLPPCERDKYTPSQSSKIFF